MSSNPFLVLTAIMDASARAAAVTRSHGDALERAFVSIGQRPVAGVDLVELPIPPQAFAALRKQLQHNEGTIAVYDLFPLAPGVAEDVRRVAGQFLAAEVLWTLEEQGLLSGVPMNIKIDVPSGWNKAPKEIHSHLVKAGALELSSTGIQTFKEIKTAWDQSQVQS